MREEKRKEERLGKEGRERDTRRDEATNLEVEERLLHLAFLGNQAFIDDLRRSSELRRKKGRSEGQLKRKGRDERRETRRTLTFPFLAKSKTAKLQTYPTPSTWTVNSLKKSMIAGAHAGSESQRTKGVRTTDNVS